MEVYYEIQFYQRRGKRKDAKTVRHTYYADALEDAREYARDIRLAPLTEGSIKIVKCEMVDEI